MAERLNITRCFTAAGAPLILFEVEGVGRCYTDLHHGWFNDGLIRLQPAERLADYLDDYFSSDPVLVALCRMVAADMEANAGRYQPKAYPVPTLPEAEAFNAGARPLPVFSGYTTAQKIQASFRGRTLPDFG